LVLAVASNDAETAIELIRQQQSVGLSAAELAAADSVVDLDADEAQCPACGDSFTPGVRNCPGCGLRV